MLKSCQAQLVLFLAGLTIWTQRLKSRISHDYRQCMYYLNKQATVFLTLQFCASCTSLIFQTIYREGMVKAITLHKQKFICISVFFLVYINVHIQICSRTLLIGKNQNFNMNEIQIFMSALKPKLLVYSQGLAYFRVWDFGSNTDYLHVFLIVLWSLIWFWLMYSEKLSEKGVFLFLMK